jgi:2-hydroxycyclohexanecarboxyl-CoA dehydrogenase
MTSRVLEGKVAIVTGAGRGIGRAIALAYGKEGAKVVVASRTPATVEQVTDEITAAGGTALGITCDVGHRDQIQACVDQTVKAFGTVHILVNNAQGFGTEDNPQTSTVETPFEEMSDEEWDYTYRTGVTATFWFMKAVFPYMKNQHYGKIINLSSSGGQFGMPGICAYNSNKEAIRGLTRTAANEWGQYGITVNAFSPALETDAFRSWRAARPEFVQELIDRIPMRRLGDPERDGGPLAVFLASPGSDYITGSTIMLEGGMHMMP